MSFPDTKVTVAHSFGEMPMFASRNEVANGCDIFISTCGRLKHFLLAQFVSFSLRLSRAKVFWRFSLSKNTVYSKLISVLIGYATPFRICHTISVMPHHPLYYGSANRINYFMVYLKWCGIMEWCGISKICKEMVWHNR